VKHRPWRTTEVEVVEAGGAACVKRFHDARWPGRAVGRWRDLRRARREERRLLELARAGLPVPEVLGIRETPEGVELRTRWIPGARTVAEILEDPSGPPDRLAAELGRLLAALHRAGFVHGDLHPGNVVVDAEQKAWLVDAAAIRRGTVASGDLIRAAAHAREVTSPRFRARFLVAYARAAGSDARAFVRLATTIELAAREVRRVSVVQENDRWLRDSGVCARHVEGDVEALIPHSAERDAAVPLVRNALRGGASGAVTVVRGRSAREAWLRAARLTEHRVPVLRPIALVVRPQRLAVFELPAGARDSDPARAADSAALESLNQILADRGLALRGARVVFDERGRAHVDPRSRLEDLRARTRHG
jgi:tRNA A-37 threonylcarbamoyl transferase component Bud32